MKRIVTALGAALLALSLTACGSDGDGIPEPTDADRAELSAKTAAYPQGYCVLAWEDDAEYDVECYPHGVNSEYSDRAYFAVYGNDPAYIFPVMLPRPVDYKTPKVKKSSKTVKPAQKARAKTGR